MAVASIPEQFVEFGIRNEEFIDLVVGEFFMKLVKFGGAIILGVAAASEAKDAVVDVLTKTFGKHQPTKTMAPMTLTEVAADISDIETNELDSTPDVDKQLFTQDVFEDPAAASVTDKIDKCEALVFFSYRYYYYY